MPLICALGACAHPSPEARRPGLWIGGIHACRGTVASAVLHGESDDWPVGGLEIRLRPEWHAALEAATTPLLGQIMPVRLNGRTIAEPVVNEPFTHGALALSGGEPRALERVHDAALLTC